MGNPHFLVSGSYPLGREKERCGLARELVVCVGWLCGMGGESREEWGATESVSSFALPVLCWS
jgi:hypothetical protein